jgi:hypothetical protein
VLLTLELFGQKTSNEDLIDSLLSDTLWSKRDIYDASHFLMIPLHYNFKNQKKTKPFNDFFERFLNNNSAYYQNTNSLQRLQFCYLISQYLKLYTPPENNVFAGVENELFSFLLKEVDYYWSQKTMTTWRDHGVSKYVFKGMEQRVLWKLNSSELDNSYYNKSIVDDEKFLFAIVADLNYIFNNNRLNISNEVAKQLKNIELIALKIFKERVSTDVDEFIFQKGFWFRHRDYRFAGCLTLDCIKRGENRKKDISEDTSHSLRLPLILKSLEDGSTEFKNKIFYKRLRGKLLNQFLGSVVKQFNESKCFYFTNYLDGSNGFYRYGYSTHKDSGYGPYELSETFKLGWWTFLNDQKVRDLYAISSKNLRNQEPCEYQFKDKTTRNRNPIIQKRFENGLYAQITLMASKL